MSLAVFGFSGGEGVQFFKILFLKYIFSIRAGQSGHPDVLGSDSPTGSQSCDGKASGSPPPGVVVIHKPLLSVPHLQFGAEKTSAFSVFLLEIHSQWGGTRDVSAAGSWLPN